MTKRLFEILDEMNQADAANGSQLVIIGNDMVSANFNKAGTKITMGVGGEHITDIEQGKKIPIIVLVDHDEYMKRRNDD